MISPVLCAAAIVMKKAILLGSVDFLQTGARSSAGTATTLAMVLRAALTLLPLSLTVTGVMVGARSLLLLVAGALLLLSQLVTGRTTPLPLLSLRAGKLSH